LPFHTAGVWLEAPGPTSAFPSDTPVTNIYRARGELEWRSDAKGVYKCSESVVQLDGRYNGTTLAPVKEGRRDMVEVENFPVLSFKNLRLMPFGQGQDFPLRPCKWYLGRSRD